MLGFAPLASAPLADDGLIVYDILANGLTTGSPVIQASTIVQAHDLSLNGITTGQFQVGASDLAQNHDLIISGITAGQPVVGPLAIKASRGRGVHVSAPSNNVAIVTNSPNACIVSAKFNEAA